MKLVIEQYGKFILEAIVIIALMSIIFSSLTDNEGNKGIFAVTGAQIKIDGVDYSAYTDFRGVYKMESEKEKPKISFESGRLTIGTYALSNYIKAVDYAGNTLRLKVISIKAPDGREIVESYNQNTTEVSLLQAGVYTVTLLAVDDGNNTTKTIIQIPINNQ